MKQSFLDKLAGLSVTCATVIASNEGYDVQVRDPDGIYILLAYSNTVILHTDPQDDSMVLEATSGDPLDVE